MDIKNSLQYKYERYKMLNSTGSNKYNYEKNGVLRLCLPKIFFKGNPILVTFLQLIDLRIIMIMKAIEKIRHFKHISWYD